jgi:hypothetical protein
MTEPKCKVCGERENNAIHFENYHGCHKFEYDLTAALLARAEKAEKAEASTKKNGALLVAALRGLAAKAEAWASTWKRKATAERMARIIYERQLETAEARTREAHKARDHWKNRARTAQRKYNAVSRELDGPKDKSGRRQA